MTAHPWRRWLLAISAATLVGIAAIRHGDMGVAAGRGGSATQTENVAARWSAGQRIEIDPATGLARAPDAAASADVASAPSDSALPAAQPTRVLSRDADEIHLPDGTVGVRVSRRYYHTISVCVQADGSFSSACPAPKL